MGTAGRGVLINRRGIVFIADFSWTVRSTSMPSIWEAIGPGGFSQSASHTCNRMAAEWAWIIEIFPRASWHQLSTLVVYIGTENETGRPRKRPFASRLASWYQELARSPLQGDRQRCWKNRIWHRFVHVGWADFDNPAEGLPENILWNIPTVEGISLDHARKVLDNAMNIRFVWWDWMCVPQGKRNKKVTLDDDLEKVKGEEIAKQMYVCLWI